MDFVEHVAKAQLRAHAISVPDGQVVDANNREIHITGPVAVKAQVPAGGRGKAGGVILTHDAPAAVDQLLGSKLGEHTVAEVLIETRVNIATELYLSVATDGALGSPVLMFSPSGGVDVESSADEISQLQLKIDVQPGLDELVEFLSASGCPTPVEEVAGVANKLYTCYLATDAELVEINPLVITEEGEVVAVDGKLSVDDSARTRQPELAEIAADPPATFLEAKAAENDLRFIELEGNVGVLANGAGLTMTTMDAIAHHGGSPANFLEIGGDSYTLAVPALELVLANPNVKSLVVNFCGAFARCDVMTGGVIEAWKTLKPSIPVFFSIHGTGMDEARAMVRAELDIEPFEAMDDAIASAVQAASASRQSTEGQIQATESTN